MIECIIKEPPEVIVERELGGYIKDKTVGDPEIQVINHYLLLENAQIRRSKLMDKKRAISLDPEERASQLRIAEHEIAMMKLIIGQASFAENGERYFAGNQKIVKIMTGFQVDSRSRGTTIDNIQYLENGVMCAEHALNKKFNRPSAVLVSRPLLTIK
jgi:hypothetical protein